MAIDNFCYCTWCHKFQCRTRLICRRTHRLSILIICHLLDYMRHERKNSLQKRRKTDKEKEMKRNENKNENKKKKKHEHYSHSNIHSVDSPKRVFRCSKCASHAKHSGEL